MKINWVQSKTLEILRTFTLSQKSRVCSRLTFVHFHNIVRHRREDSVTFQNEYVPKSSSKREWDLVNKFSKKTNEILSMRGTSFPWKYYLSRFCHKFQVIQDDIVPKVPEAILTQIETNCEVWGCRPMFPFERVLFLVPRVTILTIIN